MKQTTKGWVIVNIGHSITGEKWLNGYTFSDNKKEAIDKFINGTSYTWKQLRSKFNFRCVRATMTIETEETI